ncbi:hypothetical protein EDC96DRAFT_541178 [Choanephora cucurbitarum]|nr:hypothetical protein EDC96DRAFT_541178 [Choanephora cucurbitarum]
MDLAALLSLWRLWWLSLAATQPSSMFLSRVCYFCCCMVPVCGDFGGCPWLQPNPRPCFSVEFATFAVAWFQVVGRLILSSFFQGVLYENVLIILMVKTSEFLK